MSTTPHHTQRPNHPTTRGTRHDTAQHNKKNTHVHADVYVHVFEYVCVRVYVYIYIYIFLMKKPCLEHVPSMMFQAFDLPQWLKIPFLITKCRHDKPRAQKLYI